MLNRALNVEHKSRTHKLQELPFYRTVKNCSICRLINLFFSIANKSTKTREDTKVSKRKVQENESCSDDKNGKNKSRCS